MHRLIAFGCSLTYGLGLADPEQTAWPKVLADMYTRQCVNNGVPGASAKEIAYNILNFKFDPTDIVYINWSYFTRSCVITEKKIIQLGRWNKRFRGVKAWIAYYYNKHNERNEGFAYINLCNHFLKKKKIKTYNMLVYNGYIDYAKEFIPYHKTDFLKDCHFDEYINYYPLNSNDIDHPNEEGHAKFAKLLYDKSIKEEYAL